MVALEGQSRGIFEKNEDTRRGTFRKNVRMVRRLALFKKPAMRMFTCLDRVSSDEGIRLETKKKK